MWSSCDPCDANGFVPLPATAAKEASMIWRCISTSVSVSDASLYASRSYVVAILRTDVDGFSEHLTCLAISKMSDTVDSACSHSEHPWMAQL